MVAVRRDAPAGTRWPLLAAAATTVGVVQKVKAEDVRAASLVVGDQFGRRRVGGDGGGAGRGRVVVTGVGAASAMAASPP